MTAEARIVVDERGADRVARRIGQIDTRLKATGRTSGRVSSLMTRQFKGLSSAASKLGGAIAAVGAAAKAKEILDFDDTLGLLQGKMKASTTEANALRDKILEQSAAFGVDKKKLLGYVMALQDFGGHVKTGMRGFAEMIKIAEATGTAYEDVAKIQAVLIESGMDVKQQVTAFAQLNAQADAGKISMAELAAVFPTIIKGARNVGLTGKQAVEQLGAALQLAREGGAGSAEEARTQVSAFLSAVVKRKKIIEKKLKIKLFDEKGNLRNINTLFDEISRRTKGGKGGLLAETFTNKRVLDFVLAGVKGGAYRKMQAKATKGATAASIEEQFSRRVGGVAKTAKDAQQALAKLDVAATRYGATLINFLAADPTTTAGVAVGGYAALKVLPRLGKWLMTRRAGGAGGGGGLGGLGGGVQRVYVVNMGRGGMGTGGGAGPGKGTVSKGFAAAGGVAAAAAAGWAIGQFVNDITKELTGRTLSEHIEPGFMGKGYAVQEQAKRTRVEAHRQVGAQLTAFEQVRRMAQLSTKHGLTKAEIAPGRKIDLTPESIAKIAAARQGITDPEIIANLRKMAEKELKVIVQPAGGIEKINVQASRGQRQ